jgi:hypothetical protein
MQAAGLKKPSDITPQYIMRRVSETQVVRLSDLIETLEPNVLLKDDMSQLPAVFKDWQHASANRFTV